MGKHHTGADRSTQKPLELLKQREAKLAAIVAERESTAAPVAAPTKHRAGERQQAAVQGLLRRLKSGERLTLRFTKFGDGKPFDVRYREFGGISGLSFYKAGSRQPTQSPIMSKSKIEEWVQDGLKNAGLEVIEQPRHKADRGVSAGIKKAPDKAVAAERRFDVDAHLKRIGTPDYAERDFGTQDYFVNNLLPSLKELAQREGKPMQASWQADRGTWMITNAENQPTRNAFVIVDVNGTWRDGPKYDGELLSRHAFPDSIDWKQLQEKHRAGSVRAPKERKPPANNRAVFDGDTLVLPAFSLYASGGHGPHHARQDASYVNDNGVTFTVEHNRTHTRWWAYATKSGMRMSNTASTGSPEIAKRWEEAVLAGRVRTAERQRAEDAK